ncbi:DNA-binding response regulator [Paenibacillus sp. J31TS4]|uniref:response regulator transcription factor n=1 Tax=Paenibacillus sp. J31TS4 TaxID=2807195 RepID=UPI001B1D5514|nr:response regulator transcription factor [Paenibacillus sp. J31TS4]GIP37356.1 DNA-binding response regulator [Paenibacillus sp. J31TS4]
MNANKVLIVDDEPNIREVIRLYLEHAGYEPVLRPNGHGLLDQLRVDPPGLVLLDVMLPDISGFELCRLIRQEGGEVADIPIILLTAKDEPIDKLRGFNLGVDDYIVKPFDPNELVARIKAVLRRAAPRPQPAVRETAAAAAGHRVLDFGTLWIDLDRYRVVAGGIKADLTPKEIELLYFMASSPGRVFTRDDLLVHVWNYDFAGGTRTVDAHVKNIRKKLGVYPNWSIQTLWGIGYSFEVTHA